MTFAGIKISSLISSLRLWGFVLLFFSPLGAVFSQYSFEQISKSDGLSHNNVESIIEDNDGFMWFGTRNGLCRYDGYEIRSYRNTSDPNSISGNRILSIAEDKEGDLWIGTYQNGLNRFDKKKNKFYRYGEDSGIGNQVLRIKVLKDGKVYIGSNNGLSVYDSDSKEFTCYTPDDSEHSINAFLISDILETRDERIFIASWENDIQEYHPEKGQFTSISYIPEDLIVVNYRKRLLEDLDGNLWISAQTHGLCRYNLKTGVAKFFHEGENELNTEILNGDMVLSADGKIWISSDIGGINIFDPKSGVFEYITNKADSRGSLPSDHIYTLYQDRSNRIWVGTFDKGVAYYDPLMNKFSNTYLSENIYSHFYDKSVISLFNDKNGTLWIGTDGQGLHSIDNNLQLQSYFFDESNSTSVSSNVITSLGEDANGNILVGTYSGGLSVFNPKTKLFKRYYPDAQNENALHSENVWTLICDSEGNNWLGLLGNGADVFDSEKEIFKNIGPYSNELIKVGYPNVMSIMEDADGDIWFGTEGDGIYIFDKQAGKVLRIASNTDSKVGTHGVIKDMFQDSRGDIWIATEGDGLYKYNEGTKNLIQYTISQGLPGMIVLGIQEDNAGSIWVSTYDGLAILRSSTDNFTAFYSSDGLSSNEFNAEAFIKLNNGYFVLGSINGIDIFDPLNIRFNQNIPRIIFTRLTILNKEVLPGDTINKKVFLQQDIAYTKEVTLTNSEKTFSIEFAALNFTHPQKCQYKYMLEGFDDEWIQTSVNHRIISYSNLSDGDYTFKVQASNNDGKWGNNFAELHISVLPPFWKTPWFISIIVLLISTAIIFLYLNRLRLIKRKFQREQALSENRILELEKENIESELEKLTYYTINRNRVLIRYKNRLQSLSIKAKETVKKGLHVVIEDIDKEIADDKEWKYIEPRLDKFHNNFISKLREKHPDLTLSEIKIAAYVRMNLTSKEISEFMHKTIRAVENDRYRLRKKINLDSNDSLQNYLLNL